MTNNRLGQHSGLALPRDIILVYGSLRTGGIETLIVRIANFFASSGVRVSVCCTAGGGLELSLDKRVNVVVYANTIDLMRAIDVDEHRHVEPELLIISFDPISAARGLMLETVLSKHRRVNHVSGVFHPRAYFMNGERRDRIYLNYLVSRAIGKKYFFFMNEECKRSHANRWNLDLTDCPIVALPINTANTTWKPSGKTSLRIVSVGRLVDFKAYNLGAAGIVRDCLDRGLKVTWDIFGDGPLENLVKAEIEANGVIHQVRLMGELGYGNFSATVADYDLFVGMGTATLEAAMVGVPTICATVDEARRCYGYLSSLPFGNVGESLDKPPTREMVDLIQEYSELGQAQRSALSKQSRTAAERYGMPTFAESLSSLVSNGHDQPRWLTKKLTAELYRHATESYAAKAARRLKSRKKTCSA